MTDIVSECRAEGSNIAQRCADEIEALQARALAAEAQVETLRAEVERLMGRVEGQAAEMAMWKQQCRAAGDKLREADKRALAAEAQRDKLVEALEAVCSRWDLGAVYENGTHECSFDGDLSAFDILVQDARAALSAILSNTPASTGAAVIEAAVKLAPGLEKEPGIDIELRPLVAAFCAAVAAHRREGQDNG